MELLNNSSEIYLLSPIDITVTGIKRRRFKLSFDEEREVLKCLRSDIPLAVIAHLFGISRSAIYRTGRRLSAKNSS